jgi:hypothetical protein
MSDELPFYRLDSYPSQVTSASVIVRLVDSLGFRFRWATEGLTEQNYTFSPGQGSQSIGQLVAHIWGLINWISTSVTGQGEASPETPQGQRDHALHMMFRLREHISMQDDRSLASITIRGLPFWHILNGPLADALTHVGQINMLRRLDGNPTPKARVFTGEPPADKAP